jgi:hypothetical protein
LRAFVPLRIFVSALAVLLLTHCAQDSMAPPEGVLHDGCNALTLSTPADATDAQRDGIIRAAAAWNELGFTHLDVDGKSEPIALRFEKAAGMFHGLYDTDTGEVLINQDLTNPDELGVVIAHEVGHAMGLPHIALSARRSVMNPGNLTVGPTAEDSASVQALCAPAPTDP